MKVILESVALKANNESVCLRILVIYNVYLKLLLIIIHKINGYCCLLATVMKTGLTLFIAVTNWKKEMITMRKARMIKQGSTILVRHFGLIMSPSAFEMHGFYSFRISNYLRHKMIFFFAQHTSLLLIKSTEIIIYAKLFIKRGVSVFTYGRIYEANAKGPLIERLCKVVWI